MSTVKTHTKLVMAAIKAAGNSLASSEEKIQEAAILCVEHARMFHDVSLAGVLINELAQYKAYDALLLKKWFMNQGPFGFEMSEDKTTVENVKELKDDKGNLKTAYKPMDVLEASPVSFTPPKTTKTAAVPKPISYEWFQAQITKLETKLAQAIEPDGPGILIGMKGDKPIIAHKNNKNYKPFFDTYSTYIRGVKEFAAKVVALPRNQAEEQGALLAKQISAATHDTPATLEGQTEQKQSRGRPRTRKAA